MDFTASLTPAQVVSKLTVHIHIRPVPPHVPELTSPCPNPTRAQITCHCSCKPFLTVLLPYGSWLTKASLVLHMQIPLAKCPGLKFMTCLRVACLGSGKLGLASVPGAQELSHLAPRLVPGSGWSSQTTVWPTCPTL